MNGYRMCRGGDHRAPHGGGSCPCGMVTRIPAQRPEPVAPAGAEVLALLERCLRDGPGVLDPVATGLLRERAAQLLAALDLAGPVPAAGVPEPAAA